MNVGYTKEYIKRAPESQKMYDFRIKNDMSVEELSNKTGLARSTLRTFELRVTPKSIQPAIFLRCKEVGLDFAGFPIANMSMGRFIRHDKLRSEHNN